MHNAITHHVLTNAQLVPRLAIPPSLYTRHVLWFNSSQQLNTTQPLTHPERRFPAPTSQFLYWMGRHMVWNTPLATLGQLPWLCPLPTSCAPAAFLLAGHEKLKNP